MAIKKTQIYSSLFAGADALRGSMETSEYKDYCLTLLFLKYISDNKKAKGASSIIEIPKGCFYDDILALRNTPNIGEDMDKIVGKIAAANEDVLGEVLNNTVSFNDESKLGKGKDKADRLSALVGIFASLELGSNLALHDDLLGDAYEYFCRSFASKSGQSKGEFYTPSEVSSVLSSLLGIEELRSGSDYTVYDPTCGSGSLLLKAASKTKEGVEISIYGQEKSTQTTVLCKMNMFIHGVEDSEIAPAASTLSTPFFKKDGALKAFDFIVANPPFSLKNWTQGFDPAADPYGRFSGYAIPPLKCGDFAFVLHILKSLKSSGRAALILPHGVLFRGNAEEAIRTKLVKEGVIKAVIGLPANLFYGTSIPACVLVLEKGRAENSEDSESGIFMIDASSGFIKDGNKNRLRAMDIRKIIDTYKAQSEIAGYSRFIPASEIRENEYNLNITRYIEKSERATDDLDGHLYGGISEALLNDALGSFTSLKSSLFSEIRPNYFALKSENILEAIHKAREFSALTSSINLAFEAFESRVLDALECFNIGSNVKALEALLGDTLLASFKDIKLIECYEFYEELARLLAAHLSDELYMIALLGYKGANDLVLLDKQKKQKGEKGQTQEFDIELGSGNKAKSRFLASLLKPAEIEALYFASESSKLAKLAEIEEAKVAEFQSFLEENKDELEDALNASGNFTEKACKDAIKECVDTEDREALEHLLELNSEKKKATTCFNKARAALNAKIVEKYDELDNGEIQEHFIHHHTLDALHAKFLEKKDALALNLASSLKELSVKYEASLGSVEASVEEAKAMMAEVLKGLSC